MVLTHFRTEKDKMSLEKRTLVLTHFPRFLTQLEEQIYSVESPIWDPEFKQSPPAHMTATTNHLNDHVLTQQGGKKRPVEADDNHSRDKGKWKKVEKLDSMEENCAIGKLEELERRSMLKELTRPEAAVSLMRI